MKLLNIKTGQVFRCKKDINPTDIDFKMTAVTWFGKNISHIWNGDRGSINWKTGDIAFVSTNGLIGFEGFSEINESSSTHRKRDYYLTNSVDTLQSWKHHFITIAVECGLMEIVSISDTNLSDEDAAVKSYRIEKILQQNQTIWFRDYIDIFKYNEVYEYGKFTGKYYIKGAELVDQKFVEFGLRDLTKDRFRMESGVMINGYRFDEKQLQYNKW